MLSRARAAAPPRTAAAMAAAAARAARLKLPRADALLVTVMLIGRPVTCSVTVAADASGRVAGCRQRWLTAVVSCHPDWRPPFVPGDRLVREEPARELSH